MELLFEAAGWVGAAAILGAFLSVSMGWLKAGRAFQTANLLGACAFIINGAFHEAWPSVVSNIVWFLISAVALIRLRPVRHMPGVPEPTGPLPIIDASSESGAAGKRAS